MHSGSFFFEFSVFSCRLSPPAPTTDNRQPTTALKPLLHELEFEGVLALIAAEAKSTLGKDAVARRRPMSTVGSCEDAQADLAVQSRDVFHDKIVDEILSALARLTGMRCGAPDAGPGEERTS